MANKISTLLTPILTNIQINRFNTKVASELDIFRKEMDELPEGSLRIRPRNGHIQFNRAHNGQVRGITRFPDFVYKLARREFLQLQSELLDLLLEEGWTKDTEQLILAVCSEIEEHLKKCEEAGLNTDRITMTPLQQIWNADRHSQKTTRKEELIYPTKGRVYMRSKSERFIGNILESLHIPYRYETELVINNRSYHPDFIIMLPNGQLVILEHVGRLDLRTYDENLIIRLQAYDSIGLMIGRDLFFSFEHDTRDEDLVKEILFQILTSTPSENHIMQSLVRRAVKANARETTSGPATGGETGGATTRP